MFLHFFKKKWHLQDTRHCARGWSKDEILPEFTAHTALWQDSLNQVQVQRSQGVSAVMELPWEPSMGPDLESQGRCACLRFA